MRCSYSVPFFLQGNDWLRAIEKWVEVEACLRGCDAIDMHQIAFKPDSVPGQAGQNPRECLPGHSERRGDHAFLERQPNRLALRRVFSQPQQITADALFGGPELQVF